MGLSFSAFANYFLGKNKKSANDLQYLLYPKEAFPTDEIKSALVVLVMNAAWF